MKDIKTLFKYFKNKKILLISSLFLALVYVVGNLLIPLFSAKIIDDINAMINTNNFYFDYKVYLISGFILIVVVIAQYFFISLINIFVEKVMKQLKDDVYQKLNNVPIS